MNFQNSEPGSDGSEAPLDYAVEGVAEAAATGLSRRVSEALADPIVQALMAADRVEPKRVEELLRRVAAQLCGQPGPWRFS